VLSRSMLLTLDAGSGRKRPRDDDESVIVSCGRPGQHRGDGVTRPSSAIADGQVDVAAAGRIHVEVEIGIAVRKQGSSGIEHRLTQLVNGQQWVYPHESRGEECVAVAGIAQVIGDEGSRCR